MHEAKRSLVMAVCVALTLAAAATPTFSSQIRGDVAHPVYVRIAALPTPIPAADSVATETARLVNATWFLGWVTLGVVLVALLVPFAQREWEKGVRARERQDQSELDEFTLLGYINYFGEQMEHAAATEGQTSGASRAALEVAMPQVLKLILSLPKAIQEDANFAFIDAFRVVVQGENDDKRIIEMMKSFNARRQEIANKPSPQSSGMSNRLQEDEERFTKFRTQIEKSLKDDAETTRSILDNLSRTLGGGGAQSRNDVQVVNPQDAETDRFKT